MSRFDPEPAAQPEGGRYTRARARHESPRQRDTTQKPEGPAVTAKGVLIAAIVVFLVVLAAVLFRL